MPVCRSTPPKPKFNGATSWTEPKSSSRGVVMLGKDLQPEARMNPVTLRFAGDLENDFIEDYFRNSLMHVRFAVLSGMFLYAIFGYMDGKLAPEAKHTIWLIRYAV